MWLRRHGNKRPAQGFTALELDCLNAPDCNKTVSVETDTPEDKPPKFLCWRCKQSGAPDERFSFGKGDHNNKYRGSDLVPLSFSGREVTACNVYSTGRRAYKFTGCS